MLVVVICFTPVGSAGSGPVEVVWTSMYKFCGSSKSVGNPGKAVNLSIGMSFPAWSLGIFKPISLKKFSSVAPV